MNKKKSENKEEGRNWGGGGGFLPKALKQKKGINQRPRIAQKGKGEDNRQIALDAAHQEERKRRKKRRRRETGQCQRESVKVLPDPPSTEVAVGHRNNAAQLKVSRLALLLSTVFVLFLLRRRVVFSFHVHSPAPISTTHAFGGERTFLLMKRTQRVRTTRTKSAPKRKTTEGTAPPAHIVSSHSRYARRSAADAKRTANT